ncbi:MAG TPA: alpha/beta hydrolase [Bacteroidales bacterium]|nr:alpha/beta hydrolase [Bacteroidales bacterium]
MGDFCYYKNFKIHYKQHGAGDAVVLLHGFTESLNIWNDFSERLSVSYHVISIDLPGHGLSECVSQVHTMEMMAGCVKNVLDTIGVKLSVIIGHSMGGYVALAFADIYPAMMKGLGLFHSYALADTPEKFKNRMRTNNLIKNNLFNFLGEFIPSLFTLENQLKYVSEINDMVRESEKMSPEAVLAANSGMAERPDRTHVLNNAPYPVLFIAGKLDVRLPLAVLLEQIGMPSDSTALLMGDVAHMGYMEAKDKTYYAVKTFVDKCYR